MAYAEWRSFLFADFKKSHAIVDQMQMNEFTSALHEWINLLGYEKVLSDSAVPPQYRLSTLGIPTAPAPAVLFPTTIEQVVAIVEIAAKYHVALYPISVGNNWGFGSRVPPAGECVVVDLSRMNNILEFNKELGLVTLEPGVTVKQLINFLTKEQAPFITPVSGAGSNVSIVGNALERGYGAGRSADRFFAIMALEVVLADGTVYYSSFEKKNPSPLSGFFKWGIGPYLDGLFGQSNLGIVVRATIALTPKPLRTDIFLFQLKKGRPIGECITAMRNSFQTLGTTQPSIRLQTPLRNFVRLLPYPEQRGEQALLDDNFVRTALEPYGVDGWTIAGSLQGDPRVVRAARKVIKDTFQPYAKRIWFLQERNIDRMSTLLKRYGTKWLQRRFSFLLFMQSHLTAVAGRATDKNPVFPFWKRPRRLIASRIDDIDFDLDPNCGFIFFAGVLPLITSHFNAFLDIVDTTCPKYGLAPLPMFNSFSDRALYFSVSLLFDRNNPDETKKAHDCYRELFEKCRRQGIHVSRAATHAMDLVVDMDHPFWQTAEKIKKALDPDNIMSPGRYSKYRRADEE